MVDPLTFIGAAASIVGIVEALAKTVSTLHELHSRWKEADFTFVGLIAQLTALKAALTKLQGWMDAGLDEGQDPYHQLVIDLELNIACCKMLVHKMDAEVLELYQNADNRLDSQSKVKLIVKNGTFEGLQKMVDRQTSALTLLLTVCNCKAISDQKTLLEKSTTRKMIRRIKDDTSSLYVLRGSMSLHSRASQQSDALSKISKKFDFDRELFISKVYERIHEKVLRSARSDTVHTLRRLKNTDESAPVLAEVPAKDSQQPDENIKLQSTERGIEENLLEFDHESLISKVYEGASSKNIVENLHPQKHNAEVRMQFSRTTEEEELRRRSEDCRVLVLGDDECGQVFLKQAKIFHSHGIGFSTEELQEYKAVVRNNVQRVMNAMNSVLGQVAIELDETTKGYARLLSQELIPISSSASDVAISIKAAEAAQGLWASEQFSMLLQSTYVRLARSAEYFIEEIKRIAEEDYIPTISDVLRTFDTRPGIREYQLNTGSLSLRMYDVSGQSSDRTKWIHQFENVVSIIYFVDLSCYNEVNFEDSHQNRLMESLDNFGKVVYSPLFFRSSVVLFLCNMGDFQHKLIRYPLSNYFPDYTGGNEISRASKHIIDQFLAVNPHTNIYPHICEATDYKAIRLLATAARETIILHNLWGISGAGTASKQNIEETNNNYQDVVKDYDIDENLERGSKVDDGEYRGGERQTAAGPDIVLVGGEGPQM